MKKLLSLLLLFVIAFSSFTAAPAEAASAKISKKKKTVYVGQSFKLKIKNSKKDYVWKSSDNSVAIVVAGAGQSAVIGAIKPGKATITATAGKKTFKCKVTVKVKPEDKIPEPDDTEKDPDKDSTSGNTGTEKDPDKDSTSGDTGTEKDPVKDSTSGDTGKDGNSGKKTDDQKKTSVPTLEEELASDTYGLLYPRQKTDYRPRIYYNISSNDDLLKVMIDGIRECTRGIVVKYDRQNFNYWKTLYLDYINLSEMCNSTNVFYADSEDSNTMAVSPIYKEGWKALTYYKYIRPGMDDDLREYITPSDDTLKILKMAHEIAEDAVKAYPDDERAILKYVNNKICDLTTYSDPIPESKEAPARDVTGVFLNHDAVCEGYTATMQLVMNILGFENHTVKNKKDTHIWNRVKVDGTWYHIDATWNDRKDSAGNYENSWFMLTDDEITKKNGSSDAHAWTKPKFME